MQMLNSNEQDALLFSQLRITIQLNLGLFSFDMIQDMKEKNGLLWYSIIIMSIGTWDLRHGLKSYVI